MDFLLSYNFRALQAFVVEGRGLEGSWIGQARDRSRDRNM